MKALDLPAAVRASGLVVRHASYPAGTCPPCRTLIPSDVWHPINSARYMPPVLTVTPNEVEQLIECVRSIGHTFTLPKIARCSKGLQCLEGNCEEMEKEGIHRHGPIFVGSFIFSHVSCNNMICYMGQACSQGGSGGGGRTPPPLGPKAP